MAKEQVAIGIDLGGTNIKGVLVDENGHILHKLTYATLDDHMNELRESGESWKKAIYDMVQKLKEKHQQKVEAIGLAAPGIPNEANDSIVHMPGRLQGLEQFNWIRFLDEKNTSVSIINDAQAALVAESAFGVGRELKNIVMLTLGTGVGGGIMINGQLYQGNYQRAGHLGHVTLNAAGSIDITGMPGSLEEVIGNVTLPRRSLGRFESTQELVKAFKKGDHFAAYVWLEAVRNLSIGISSLINAFSPDAVILGGGITKAGDALFEPLEQFLDIYEWKPGGIKTPLKRAAFDNFAGAIGAATFSMNVK